MKNSIGYRIRKLREAMDLNQAEVAAKLKITPGAYSKIERGTTDPSVGRLEQLALIFKVEIVSFFADASTVASTRDKEMEQLRQEIASLQQDVALLKMAIHPRAGRQNKKR